MLTLDSPIDQVLADYPQLAEVFVGRRMLCVGCDIGRFHTLAESAEQYGLHPDAFLAELQARLSGQPGVPTPGDQPDSG